MTKEEQPAAPGRDGVPAAFRSICQDSLPVVPWTDPVLSRLPGMRPLAIPDWIVMDDAYDRQMAYRDWLVAQRPGDVLARLPGAAEAAAELLDLVLAAVSGLPGYRVSADTVRRPDGVKVDLRREQPMVTVARLSQDDFCLLQPRGGAHVLTAAALCFPASWTLEEKLGQPLMRIHRPVAAYTGDLCRRVQRMFDRLRPESAMVRANALVYSDPDLHQPRPEAAPKVLTGDARWVRVERQTIRKLPASGVIAFGIHTYLVSAESLDPVQRSRFDKLT